MNEFWAIVLGAALATTGGIIGTLFSNSIEKRRQHRNRKAEAYVKTLNFLHKVKFKSCKGYTVDEVAEICTVLSLYATDEIDKKFRETMSKIIQYRNRKEEQKNEFEQIENDINFIAAQIKMDLEMTLRKSDVETYKTIIENMEKNNAN